MPDSGKPPGRRPSPPWLRTLAASLVTKLETRGITITPAAAEDILGDRVRASAATLQITERTARTIDSSTAAGRMMIGVLGSLAEYERELIKERTALKRAASRANGTRFGRPRQVNDTDHIATARRMKADGHTGKDIAKAFDNPVLRHSALDPGGISLASGPVQVVPGPRSTVRTVPEPSVTSTRASTGW